MNKYIEKLLNENKFGFDVMLCTHCNLRCRGCSRFSNIAKPKFYSFEQYKKDLLHIKETNIILDYITFSGGEPTLHKDLLKFCEYTRELYSTLNINILSNLIKIQTQNDDFFKVLKQYNIGIIYSRYPCSIVNFKKIQEKIDKFNIKFTNILNIDNEVWRLSLEEQETDLKQYFYIEPLSINENSKDADIKRKECCLDCSSLWDSKIWICSKCLCSDAVNVKYNTNFLIDKEDYLDVSKIYTIDDIKRYFLNCIPFCKYCRNTTTKKIHWQLGYVKEDFICE